MNSETVRAEVESLLTGWRRYSAPAQPASDSHPLDHARFATEHAGWLKLQRCIADVESALKLAKDTGPTFERAEQVYWNVALVNEVDEDPPQHDDPCEHCGRSPGEVIPPIPYTSLTGEPGELCAKLKLAFANYDREYPLPITFTPAQMQALMTIVRLAESCGQLESELSDQARRIDGARYEAETAAAEEGQRADKLERELLDVRDDPVDDRARQAWNADKGLHDDTDWRDASEAVRDAYRANARDELSQREAKPVDRDALQSCVLDWATHTFGADAVTTNERARRFIEEAVELAQAEGLTEQMVQALTHHVFSKPPGDPKSEAGGVGITLLAYCQAKGFSAMQAEADEFTRVSSIPADYFRKRHNAKADAGIAVRVPVEEVSGG